MTTERRKNPRSHTSFEVEVSGGGLQEPRNGVAVNMGVDSAFIEMGEPTPARHSAVTLRFTWPDGTTFQCQATVKRFGVAMNGRLGVGVQLVLSPTEAETLAAALGAEGEAG